MLHRHVEEKKILKSGQHGFTKGLSILMAFSDGVGSWGDGGRAVGAVQLGFSKALDTAMAS